MRSRVASGALLAALTLLSGQWNEARASLTPFYQFNGKGNWSIDGVGANSAPVGTIDASVPLGSTVVKAFLYSTTQRNPNTFVPNVVFDGTVYSGGAWTSLGLSGPFNLQAFRADVTAQVTAKIGGGGAGLFNFVVNNETPNPNIDGEALVIIYSNAAEQTRTIAILDGASNPAGDSATFNFLNPVNKGVGFEALMSLGIGFGFQGVGQHSLVDVNSSRLTSSAGGQDDGVPADGGLITIGGIGDSTANPANPNQTSNGNPRLDDELYDVENFINNGDTAFNVDTLNPSFDDNIFFLGLNITAEGQVGTVPEPSSIIMAAMGLVGVIGYRRRKGKIA